MAQKLENLCGHDHACGSHDDAGGHNRSLGRLKTAVIGAFFVANSHILLMLFFLFSPLFSLSAQQNDTEVNVLESHTNQNGEVSEIDAKPFLADFITALGRAPERAIYLRKTFTPPGKYKFRPFRPDEKQKMLWYLEHPLKIRIDPYIATLIWQFWENDIPQYVDFWFDPETEIYGAPRSTFQDRAIIESPGRIIVTACFADSNTAAKFPLRCDGNLVSPSGKGEATEVHWAAKVAGGIDMDIDNDNNNNSSEGVFGIPARDLEEDRWESADKNDKGEKLPGKFIPVNDGDADNDQIPGFADGFGKFGNESNTSGGQFVPAVLDISTVTDKEIIDWTKAKIKFKYSASGPDKTVVQNLDNDPNKKYYMPENGMIRIWTKNADKARNMEPFGNGGDFISGDNQEFYADRLFRKGNEANGERMEKIDLFIEGIGSKTTSGLIEVKFSPKGDNTWMPDEVKVTVVGIDLDVDSDNDGNITDADDPIEEVSPGMLVGLNDSGAIINKKNMNSMILRKLVPSDLTGWEVHLTQTGGGRKSQDFQRKRENCCPPYKQPV